MQTAGDLLFVSPTDLTKFLACRHATRLDRAVARGQLARPDEGTFNWASPRSVETSLLRRSDGEDVSEVR